MRSPRVCSRRRTRSAIGGTINSNARIMMRARMLTRGLSAPLLGPDFFSVSIAIPTLPTAIASKHENPLGRIAKI
jgi:hypothetical protein